MHLANTPGMRRLRRAVRRARPLGSSAEYWERRYRAGGTSGSGSYGSNARAKADVVNRVVREHDVASVVEFGCGDGNQLSLLDVPSYIGLDVSPTAIDLCTTRFADDMSKSFFRYDPVHFVDRAGVFRCDLALSQEVIFHLVEDDVFDRYMTQLFAGANRLVLICSSDHEATHAKHVRHRKFTDWVAAHKPSWSLIERIEGPSSSGPGDDDGLFADFFVYGSNEQDR
jgi:hypothetical protein